MKAGFAAAALLMAGCATQATHTEPASYTFENGRWFDGQGFVERAVSVVGGRLVIDGDPREALNTIDLAGDYVVPPFCEAHNHNLGDSAELDDVQQTVAAYLQYGVFYAMMHGSFATYRQQIADLINTPESVDVAFANNGLTGSGGHPRRLREFLMDSYGSYPEFTKDTLPDAGYFEADTPDELREKWTLILAEKPDFIKVMLLFSEEYESRKGNPEYYGERGLNPDLLPGLVQMAQEAGLRVSVHVETDADMQTALRSGADMIAHMPSHDAPIRLSDETVALAADTQAGIITTLSLADRLKKRDPDLYEPTLEAQRDNLSRLSRAGANLVLGSDNVRDVSVGEARHIVSLDVLDNAALLRMWTENCASTVFPDRKIGRLEDGYEASFIVLEGNPLTDFDQIDTITLRLKDGEILDETSSYDIQRETAED
ncbi:MAG: amidohydrolase family protein [Henriciella sp.]